MSCNRVCQRSGNNRFYSNRTLRHSSLLDSSCTDIIKQQSAHLIAAYQLIGTVRTFHGNTHTVSIRICCQHQIGICLLSQIQSQLQSCKNLRIRITAGGKVAVRVLLLRNNGNVRNSHVI